MSEHFHIMSSYGPMQSERIQYCRDYLINTWKHIYFDVFAGNSNEDIKMRIVGFVDGYELGEIVQSIEAFEAGFIAHYQEVNK